jgi:hypothetical protein
MSVEIWRETGKSCAACSQGQSKSRRSNIMAEDGGRCFKVTSYLLLLGLKLVFADLFLWIVAGTAGCRGADLPHSTAQGQPDSRIQSHRQPCLYRPASEPTEDAAMIHEVRSRGILPDIQNMTPQNATLATKAQNAMPVLMAFFGDPQESSIPSMADFSDLADDTHARETLGQAFAHQQDDTEVAEAERTMSETEKQYFESATSTMSYVEDDEGRLAARLEVPLIGTLTTMDSRSYLNLMLSESRRLRIALNAMPDNRRALWWIQYRTGQLIDKLNAGCSK